MVMDKSLRESSVDFQSFISGRLLQILDFLRFLVSFESLFASQSFQVDDVLGRRGGNFWRSRSMFMIAAAVFQIDTWVSAKELTKTENVCASDVFDCKRKRQKETETDSESAFWPLYCIFQWRLHIPENRPHDWRDGGGHMRVGAVIVGLNYLVDQMGRGELSRVKEYVCAAFPSSVKRPCSQKQRTGPNSFLNGTIKSFRWRDGRKPLSNIPH